MRTWPGAKEMTALSRETDRIREFRNPLLPFPLQPPLPRSVHLPCEKPTRPSSTSRDAVVVRHGSYDITQRLGEPQGCANKGEYCVYNVLSMSFIFKTASARTHLRVHASVAALVTLATFEVIFFIVTSATKTPKSAP